MIKHSFSLLSGVGEKLERRLWSRGILTWDHFLARPEIEGISPERKLLYDNQLQQSSLELAMGNAWYFARTMKRREHWRLYDTFRDEALFLDIETNGLQPEHGGYVTVVGLYNGFDCVSLVRGENLTSENIVKAMAGYKCLITFYGTSFDVPFLMRSFQGLRFDIPHFDLCFAARRLGFSGGLKKLEESFGIPRDDSVKGMNGYDAVKLWEGLRRGSPEARQLLLMYNREDTINLQKLADILYERLRNSTGFDTYAGARLSGIREPYGHH